MALATREDIPMEIRRFLVSSAVHYVVARGPGEHNYQDEFADLTLHKDVTVRRAVIVGLCEAGAFRLVLALYANDKSIKVRAEARTSLIATAKTLGVDPKSFGLDPAAPLTQRLDVADLNLKDFLDSVAHGERLSDIDDPWRV